MCARSSGVWFGDSWGYAVAFMGVAIVRSVERWCFLRVQAQYVSAMRAVGWTYMGGGLSSCTMAELRKVSASEGEPSGHHLHGEVGTY